MKTFTHQGWLKNFHTYVQRNICNKLSPALRRTDTVLRRPSNLLNEEKKLFYDTLVVHTEYCIVAHLFSIARSIMYYICI